MKKIYIIILLILNNYNTGEIMRLESSGNNKFVFTSRVSEYSEAGAPLLFGFITVESKNPSEDTAFGQQVEE